MCCTKRIVIRNGLWFGVKDRGKKKEVRSLNARMLVKVLQGGTDVIISYLEKV